MSERQREQSDLTVLGRAIARIRRERRLSQDELAAAAGIERTRIEALEAGRLDPDYELLLALSEGLGVRPSALVIRAEELQAEARASGEVAES
jgi:transcriptional regulator with XRE-family HTH domain